MNDNYDGKLERHIKSEFDNIEFPKKDMISLVKQKIEETNSNPESGTNASGQYESRVIGRQVYLKRIAAVIAVMLVLSGSGYAYARYNGISFMELAGRLWGDKVVNVEQLYCEATVNIRENSFEDVSLDVVKVIGDSNGIYVVISYEILNSESASSDIKVYFDYVDVIWEGMAAVSTDIIVLERNGNSGLLAVECMAQNDDDQYNGGKSRINIKLKGGTKTYGMELNYMYNGRSKMITGTAFSQDEPIQYEVTPLTTNCVLYSEDEYYDIMDKNIMIVTYKGEKIQCVLNYGVERDKDFVISYKNNEPIDPESIESVIILDDEDYKDNGEE